MNGSFCCSSRLVRYSITIVGILITVLLIAGSGKAADLPAAAAEGIQLQTEHELPVPDVERALAINTYALQHSAANESEYQARLVSNSLFENDFPKSTSQDRNSGFLILPSGSPILSQTVLVDDWQSYQDPYWNFELMYPPDWELQNLPWRDFGFRLNSPELVVDDLGRPVKGAYLSVSASQITIDTWNDYLQNNAMDSTHVQSDDMPAGDLETVETYGVDYGNRFIERAWFSPTSRSFHLFRFVEAGLSEKHIVTATSILNTISIVGNVEKYPAPDYESLGIDLSSFSVSIKHAFQAGQGKIMADQYAGSHNGGDDHALDLCEGSGCAEGTIGQYVIAPANMKLIGSRDNNGIDNDDFPSDPLDFHFFELANDGAQRLCMSFGHFQIRLPGLIEEISVPQGALIGTLTEYRGYSNAEHIHMGLYTVASSLPSCLHVPRIQVAFTDNLKLDGIEYKPDKSWIGANVTSTNYPFCYEPIGTVQEPVEYPITPNTDLSGCFGDNGSNDTTPPSASSFSASVSQGRYAEITTSGVQDNSGGSGVKEVRFSAKWGGNWSGIGTDGSSPYTLTWDMCSNNVSDGDVELGMEVWDNAGNKWVWSEHFGNPHIAKQFDCDDEPPTGQFVWNLQAWMNKYLAGYTNWEGTITFQDYPYFYWDFGTGAPFDGWASNEFSMRFWRNVYFPGGDYSFHAYSDDGVKVFVDGKEVVNAWWDHRGESSGGTYLSPGNHEVKVEYYENTGEAIIHVYWYGPGYPKPDTQNPDGRISSPADLTGISYTPLTIWAEAWDDVSGVDYVEFWAAYCINADCGWRKLATDNSSPYAYNWDWTPYGDQYATLALDVYDKTGKSTMNAGGLVGVSLDRTNPTAQLDTPVDGAYLNSNTVNIVATANDGGSGVGVIQFFAGYEDGSGNYWHELGWDNNPNDGWQWQWNASGVSDQRDVSFFVYVYDRAGNFIGDANWATILDRTPPQTRVNNLPAASPTTFTVSWTGSDSVAGVYAYDVQYRKDGGNWQNWQAGTPLTSATFTGEANRTYSFRSRGLDMAGNLENWPSSPDTSTTTSGVSGTADIFWYAPGTTTDYLHLSNGNGTFQSIQQNIGGTYTPLVGDFNADSLADIYWYKPGTGADYLHLSNGNGTFQSKPQNIGGTYNPLVGDFNGDGGADIFWYIAGSGRDYLHLSNLNGTFQSISQNIGGTYTPLLGDFNGDGRDDIFWYSPGAGPDYLHLSNGNGTFQSKSWNIGGVYQGLVGDYNGDGADDIFWYAPGAPRDYLHLSNSNGTFQSINQNIGGTYTPLLGDYSGDGREDIFWYAPGPGKDYLHLSNGNGTFQSSGYNIGGTYTTIIGDFSGDGRDDIFWYGPGAGSDTLYVAKSDGTFQSISRAISGYYSPLVGRFD